MIELAKLPPKTTVFFLTPTDTSYYKASLWQVFLHGKPKNAHPIPIKSFEDIVVSKDFVQFTNRSGARESLPTSRFFLAGEKALTSIAAFTHTQTYWLGTDAYGRDVLSRLVLGARVSLAIGILATLLSVIVGFLLGATAGFIGGKTDSVIMAVISVIWAIPTLLLAIVLGFVMGTGFWQLMLAIALTNWVEIARLVRGQVLSIKNLPYIEAAQALGLGRWRTLYKHILPNIVSPLIVMAVANFGSAVLVESGLSFLGLGVELGVPTWGRMVYEGYNYILFENGKWLAIFPGIALILLVVSINLVGNGLKDALSQKN